MALWEATDKSDNSDNFFYMLSILSRLSVSLFASNATWISMKGKSLEVIICSQTEKMASFWFLIIEIRIIWLY